VDKALLDLGVSINLMPLALLRKIGNLEVQPTQIQLLLVDIFIKYPYSVVEDILVKVDKFTFPVDFVVMDIEEDDEFPLILGRPFMKTARIIIDVDKGKIKVRTQDDEVTFNLFYYLKNFNAGKECLQKDTPKKAFYENKEQLDLSNLIEEVLHQHVPKTVVHLEINMRQAR